MLVVFAHITNEPVLQGIQVFGGFQFGAFQIGTSLGTANVYDMKFAIGIGE
jgi:hypothetical protein